MWTGADTSVRHLDPHSKHHHSHRRVLGAVDLDPETKEQIAHTSHLVEHAFLHWSRSHALSQSLVDSLLVPGRYATRQALVVRTLQPQGCNITIMRYSHDFERFTLTSPNVLYLALHTLGALENHWTSSARSSRHLGPHTPPQRSTQSPLNGTA